MSKELQVCAKYAPLFAFDGPRYTLLTGGRGSGKSFALSLALTTWLKKPGSKILFTRYTLTSAHDSIIPEFLEKLELLGIANEFEVTKAGIRHRCGSEILFRGIKTSEGIQTAKLKSIQGVNAWILDEAEELPDEDVFDRIDLSIRDGRRANRIILSLNPAHKSHWLYHRFFSPKKDDCQYIHTDYRDNRRNLPADYLKKADECAESNARKHSHVWLGEWIEEVEGALWTWKMIQGAKPTAPPPQMRRIVVAIDPAATSTAHADETGIIVAGEGMDDKFHVLSDMTMRGTPMEWATAAIREYNRFKADRIVAEVNNGGEMVEATLRTVDPFCSYQAVHATHGKTIRAEPISALYEKGMVLHHGGFRDMEEELMTYTGKAGQKSPNRMDALVWALSSLTEGGKLVPLEIEYSKKKSIFGF
jgi:phage terminase large subunit-like protein